jgi:hypothetical protein
VQSDAELRVSPIIQHFWVNQSTGVFDPGESSSHNSLKQLMLDGYEALSGTRYVPQSSAMPIRPSGLRPASSSHSTSMTSSQLHSRIQSKLQSLDNEELFKLVTDSQAFNAELQSWLRETEAGKKHMQVYKALLQAAQSSKDLVAVRSYSTRMCLCSIVDASHIVMILPWFVEDLGGRHAGV